MLSSIFSLEFIGSRWPGDVPFQNLDTKTIKDLQGSVSLYGHPLKVKTKVHILDAQRQDFVSNSHGSSTTDHQLPAQVEVQLSPAAQIFPPSR